MRGMVQGTGAVVAGAILAIAGSARAQLPVINGWTQLTPSADSRVVYVSSSAGSDSNSGSTANTPKRTLAAAAGLVRDGFPDWLLLKCGDSWHEVFPNWTKSGRSVNEPIVVGSFGSGERPRIFCGVDNGFFAGAFTGPRAHLAITDLHFVSDGYDGANAQPAAIEVLANWSDVLVENCFAERFMTNFVFQSDPVAGQVMHDIRIRRSISVDAYRVLTDLHPEGTYLAGVDGLLLEECLFDHNGWSETVFGADPTIFRHNIYIQSNCSNVTTRRLISARAGATGMQQRAGGLCEGHLFLQNPLNIVFGTGGTVRNCVVLDSRDIDRANPRGVGIQFSSGSDHEAYGNICAWRTTPATWNLVGLSIDNSVSNVNIHDNIVWKWWTAGTPGATGIGIEGTPLAPITIRKNAVQMLTGGSAVLNPVSVQLSLSGNRYYAPTPTVFQLGNNGYTFPQWVAVTGEDSSSFTQATYPSPDRTIGTYMAALGRSPTLGAFLEQARLQSRVYWRQEYTAQAVTDYIRAGFGLPAVVMAPCVADLNHDGVLNLNDMVAFQKWYLRQDLRADVNHDGVLTMADLTLYQSIYNSGCP